MSNRNGQTPNTSRKSRQRRRPRGVATILSGRAATTAMIRPVPQQVVHVHKISEEQVVSQAAAAVFTNLYFMLSQANFADFREAFQQYTIRKVEVHFRPYFRANPANLDATYTMPLIYVAADPNDSSSWAALTDAQSAENCCVMDDSEPFMVTFRPKAAIAAGKNAVFTGFADIDQPLWVDTFDNDVRWFGLKIAISAAGAATDVQRWNISFRIFASFRLGK